MRLDIAVTAALWAVTALGVVLALLVDPAAINMALGVGIIALTMTVLTVGTDERVKRWTARVRGVVERWRARRACLDQIEGCTRSDRHYHPGSGVAP